MGAVIAGAGEVVGIFFVITAPTSLADDPALVNCASLALS
jgi:hypothetical protein